MFYLAFCTEFSLAWANVLGCANKYNWVFTVMETIHPNNMQKKIKMISIILPCIRINIKNFKDIFNYELAIQ